ncbi:MAG: DUF4124 domain-containing protein [Zoogloeaceae bacterium]|nr:DUF4124 domain-containing protein [Zoogloeaceae bacterium]
MRKALIMSLLVLPALPVQAEIFKCTDNAGHVTYSNVSSKGCTRLNLEPISSGSGGKPAAKAATPSSFPRVAEDTQRARDNDRRKILEQELATEQKSLDEAKKRLAEGEIAQPNERMQGGGINQAKVQERIKPLQDQVQLHERNLEAINKEMRNLR